MRHTGVSSQVFAKGKNMVNVNPTNMWEAFRFHQERLVSERLRQTLHADLLEPMFDKCKYAGEKSPLRAIFEGHSFRLSRKLAPRLYDMCQEVQKILKFEESVEFFASNDPTVNAVSILREDDDQSHIIAINSGLIEKFSDSELKFVIGHELGHIIFKTAAIRRLLANLFPEEGAISVPIQNLIHLWDKLAEISADRMGFVASPNLASCVTNFFKLASGLSAEKMQFNTKDYLAEMDAILENFSHNRVMFRGSHPANPIRIKAIQIFSESQMYQQFAKNGKVMAEDQMLAKKMDALVEMLSLHPDNERDHYRLLVIAASGFYLAGLDEQVDALEEEKIMEVLANFTVDPRTYLKDVLATIKKPKGLKNLMEDTVKKLLNIDPQERYPLFDYLCQIIIADRKIEKVEVDCLMDIATRLLGLHEIEANRMFVQALRASRFQPRF